MPEKILVILECSECGAYIGSQLYHNNALYEKMRKNHGDVIEYGVCPACAAKLRNNLNKLMAYNQIPEDRNFSTAY